MILRGSSLEAQMPHWRCRDSQPENRAHMSYKVLETKFPELEQLWNEMALDRIDLHGIAREGKEIKYDGPMLMEVDAR